MFTCVKINRYPRRWTVVNFLLSMTCALGIAICASLHVISFSTVNTFCYWGYIVFPGIILASKVIQTSIAIVRFLYIYCDTICRICNDMTKLILFILIDVVLVSTPYLTTRFLNGKHPYLLTSCINSTQHNYTLQHLTDDPSNFAFLGSYYIISMTSVVTVSYTHLTLPTKA